MVDLGFSKASSLESARQDPSSQPGPSMAPNVPTLTCGQHCQSPLNSGLIHPAYAHYGVSGSFLLLTLPL